MIFTRLIILVAAVLGAVAIARLFVLVQKRAVARSTGLKGVGLKPDQPALIYFWSPQCIPCKTVQAPAIDAVAASVEGLQVVSLNVFEAKDVAAAWKIVTVPTTVILDSRGAPQYINQGVAPARTLTQQLASVLPAPAA